MTNREKKDELEVDKELRKIIQTVLLGYYEGDIIGKFDEVTPKVYFNFSG